MDFSRLIQRQEFDPHILGAFTNPFYIMRSELRDAIGALSSQLQGALLDIGCGRKPYKGLFSRASAYTGVEFDSERQRKTSLADVFYDGKHLPFPSESFDSILATEVLEHVFNPDEFLQEAARVLRSGGRLLVTCPFVWDEHEQPHDYARYSSFGIRHLLAKNGFKVIEQRKSGNALLAITQLFACYLNRKLGFKNYKLKLLARVVCISPFVLIGIALSKILPKNSDLYLGNVLVAQKI